MSTYLLVDKLAQDWTEMWTPMSLRASKCDKQQFFFGCYRCRCNFAFVPVVSSIDSTNMKTI